MHLGTPHPEGIEPMLRLIRRHPWGYTSAVYVATAVLGAYVMFSDAPAHGTRETVCLAIVGALAACFGMLYVAVVVIGDRP